jgi:1,2-dihydroxy-3-keto-5-methylthiopentene dioxygenase
MSILSIYSDPNADVIDTSTDPNDITHKLSAINVSFERWEADRELDDKLTQEEIIDAYHTSIDRLVGEFGFKTIDVVSLHPDHPDKKAFREKFLAEHTHDDFEVRFFVDGKGLFYLHVDDKVYIILCERGDLISVPANTAQWFDMGENPSFKCIRFFTTPDGWQAKFTGSDITTHYPDFDEFVAQRA